MLCNQTIEVKWNSKTKKHYIELGYSFTKMGDSFWVSPEHLTNGSNVFVQIQCDYCGRIYKKRWYSYISAKKKDNNTDCCDSAECTTKKAVESLQMKYGVSNAR